LITTLPRIIPDLDMPKLLWRPVAQVFPRPDPAMQSWLMDPGSLTQRLKKMSAGVFSVKVLEERWAKHYAPSLLQCFSPHVVRERMWSRKVLLLCDDVPWVAAHSLIPISSMRAELKRLRRLENKPLGEFLFRDPQLRRYQLEISRVDSVWGRRSLFYLHGKPLLVAEFFLPALLADEVGRS